MQHVAQPPEPDYFRKTKVTRERERAEMFYADPTNAEAKFPGDYSAYKDESVKVLLAQAFHNKCAYCESPYGATQPMAVEHFRPKGAVFVDGRLRPPGYWWLASEWTNLMPSCTDCNSPRGQDLAGGAGRITAGKANQFPLSPRAKRASRRGEERREKRLLLNPYLDFPEEHLHFVADQGFRDGEVEPRRVGPARRPSRLAKASIEVYALQRRGLVDERKKVLLKLKAHLELVGAFWNTLRTDPSNAQAMAQFERALDAVRLYTDPDQPYSAMCRQVADDFMRTNLRREP